MSLASGIKTAFDDVFNFFKRLVTTNTWQTIFKAAVQTAANLVEQLLDAAKDSTAASAVQSIVAQVIQDLAVLTGLVSNYNSATHATFVSQAQAILTVISSNLNSILELADIKDSSLLSTITSIVGDVAAGLSGLLALVPTPSTAS